MSKIAFVTHRDSPRLTADDSTVFRPLAGHGLKLASAAWDDPSVRWADFALVVLRSSWNYHLKLEEFKLWLARVEEEGIPIFNAPDLMRWNMDKHYLRELAERGVPTVPTTYIPQGQAFDLGAFWAEHDWPEAVIKPTVGATAYKTQRITAKNLAGSQRRLDSLLATHDAMLQPFVDEVQTAGEWSLIFFRDWSGEITYSHAIRKRPVEGDFRSQEEFGSDIIPDVPRAGLLAQGFEAARAIQGDWLYARVDGVIVEDQFWLMELELIEPALYLKTDAEAPKRFAAAIASLLG